jgi:hypothetical protein
MKEQQHDFLSLMSKPNHHVRWRRAGIVLESSRFYLQYDSSLLLLLRLRRFFFSLPLTPYRIGQSSPTHIRQTMDSLYLYLHPDDARQFVSPSNKHMAL